jgi:phosphatidylinositol glycan class H protein
MPLPGLGIQLSTTRGLSIPDALYPQTPGRRILFTTSTSYTFIPLSEMSTVVINEGLKRWNVRYYIAIIKRQGGGVIVALDVSCYLGVGVRLADPTGDLVSRRCAQGSIS